MKENIFDFVCWLIVLFSLCAIGFMIFGILMKYLFILIKIIYKWAMVVEKEVPVETK